MENSKETILSKHLTKSVDGMSEGKMFAKLHGFPHQNVYEAMTEYRSIGEREAREQTVNELVGWMEMQQLQHSHKSHVFSTLSYCIKKAKSLLNQQGEETKKL